MVPVRVVPGAWPVLILGTSISCADAGYILLRVVVRHPEKGSLRRLDSSVGPQSLKGVEGCVDNALSA